jgi:nitrogen fixation-related uncharacterized protein
MAKGIASLPPNYRNGYTTMDIKVILAILTGLFVVATLFFGTKNGFYDTDNYHGNGSAH